MKQENNQLKTETKNEANNITEREGETKMNYNNNIKKLLRTLCWKDTEESAQEVERRMEIIPKESRKILEIKWGLVGDAQGCYYKNLSDILGVGLEEAKEAYRLAIKDFTDVSYYEVIKDREKFSYRVASNLGRLAMATLANSEIPKDYIIGAKLFEILDTLIQREVLVIKERFGLENGIPKTLEEVGVILEVTRERIRQIEAKALRKLRHPARTKEFVYSKEREEEKEFFEDYDIKFSLTLEEEGIESMDDLEFSVRTYNTLKRAGIETLEQFAELTLRDLDKMEVLKARHIIEVYEARKRIGKPF